jgi:DNA-binding MarR family transcriptional regulator
MNPVIALTNQHFQILSALSSTEALDLKQIIKVLEATDEQKYFGEFANQVICNVVCILGNLEACLLVSSEMRLQQSFVDLKVKFFRLTEPGRELLLNNIGLP